MVVRLVCAVMAYWSALLNVYIDPTNVISSVDFAFEFMYNTTVHLGGRHLCQDNGEEDTSILQRYICKAGPLRVAGTSESAPVLYVRGMSAI
jgi:hypothetical protein